MKKLLPSIAIVLLLIASALILIRNNADDENDAKTVGSANHLENPARAISGEAHALATSGEEPAIMKSKKERPALLGNLPPGADMVESLTIPGGIDVNLPDGAKLSAQSATVTENGAIFKAPYRYQSSNKTMGSMLPNDSIFMSRDGEIKRIAPSGKEGDMQSILNRIRASAANGEGPNSVSAESVAAMLESAVANGAIPSSSSNATPRPVPMPDGALMFQHTESIELPGKHPTEAGPDTE